MLPFKCEQATYNPYKYDSFVEVESGERVLEASKVRLVNKKIFFKR
jgi:hypothetical protein